MSIFDESEFLFCTKCGMDYEAMADDLGTYICPCGRKNKNIDAALERLRQKNSQDKNDPVRDKHPNK